MSFRVPQQSTDLPKAVQISPAPAKRVGPCRVLRQQAGVLGAGSCQGKLNLNFITELLCDFELTRINMRHLLLLWNDQNLKKLMFKCHPSRDRTKMSRKYKTISIRVKMRDPRGERKG